MSELSRRLEAGFARPLPGPTAQLDMAHQLRRKPPPVPANARHAAVLCLFYPFLFERDLAHKLVFIQRSSRDTRDRHAGQISFPGGSVEEKDENLEATALREAQEEIGIDPNRVHIYGRLTDLYIPVSNFMVTPFVGLLDHSPKLRPDFSPQPAEVDEVLELPIDAFLRPASRARMDKTLTSGIKLTGLPYWKVGGYEIWGATAMITSELVALING